MRLNLLPTNRSLRSLLYSSPLYTISLARLFVRSHCLQYSTVPVQCLRLLLYCTLSWHLWHPESTVQLFCSDIVPIFFSRFTVTLRSMADVSFICSAGLCPVRYIFCTQHRCVTLNPFLALSFFRFCYDILSFLFVIILCNCFGALVL